MEQAGAARGIKAGRGRGYKHYMVKAGWCFMGKHPGGCNNLKEGAGKANGAGRGG